MSAVIVSVLVDDDVDTACRRLSALVSPSRMHLARVIGAGVEVYPVRAPGVSDDLGVLQCELRLRRTGATEHVRELDSVLDDVLARLAGAQPFVVRWTGAARASSTASPTATVPPTETAA